jgi:hypothetical protein
MFERLCYTWKYWRYLPTRWRYVFDSDWHSLGATGGWTLVEDYQNGRDVDTHHAYVYEHKDTGEKQFIYGGRMRRFYMKERRFDDTTDIGGQPADHFELASLVGTRTYAPLDDLLTHDL